MKKLYKLVERAYDKKVDPIGLGLFRVFYGIILMMEVFQMLKFNHLIFDPVPYIQPQELNYTYILSVWIGVIFFIIIGFQTRIFAIVSYVLSLVFFSTLSNYEYHMDYSYMGLNFLLMFLPTEKSLSIDNLRIKLKYSNSRFYYNPDNRVSQLAYSIPIFVGIAFVYWDSIFFKFTSPMWTSGLGMWLPASMPFATIWEDQWLLNQELLMKGLGYLVLIFETVFIFLFWFKPFRLILAIIGIGLHIGILLEFPIPYFALSVTFLYFLLLPIKVWKFLTKIKFKSSKLIFYYDEECPLCARTKIILTHFDVFGAIEFKGVQTYGFNDDRLSKYSKEQMLDNIFSISSSGKVREGLDTYVYALTFIPLFLPIALLLRIPGIYHLGKSVYSWVAKNRNVERCTEDNCGYELPSIPQNNDEAKVLKNLNLKNLKVAFITFSLVILTFFQINSDLNSPPLKDYRDTYLPSQVVRVHRSFATLSKVFFGVTSHGVFMDHHFEGYDKIFAVTYNTGSNEKWLPLIDERGHPGEYIRGMFWVNFTFRVNTPGVDDEILAKGLKRYTAYWAHNNGVDLSDASFNVKIKRIEQPKNWQWEEDYLINQVNKPWEPYAKLVWDNYDTRLVKD